MSTADLSTSAGTHHGRSRHHPLLGGLLVKEGLINRAQLERVLTLQEETEPRPLLGQILLDQKLVTPHELRTVLGKYHKEYRLGDVLIETRVITAPELETALAQQRRADTPLGETLIELGLITEAQLKRALGIQLGILFIDLDDRPLEPSLASVISERYARHHRVIPIAKDDDRIVLAMDDPTDVELIAELGSCTGQRIDVVAVTAEALDRAFSRLYGGRGDARSAHGDDAGAPPTPVASETEASLPEGRDALDRKERGRARAGITLDALRTRMDALRQLVPTWERLIETVETLLRERLERRAEIERLAADLGESRTSLARTTGELEATVRVLTALETAHAAVIEERDALGRSLGDLRSRHAALLQERELVIEHLDAILRRLRS